MNVLGRDTKTTIRNPLVILFPMAVLRLRKFFLPIPSIVALLLPSMIVLLRDQTLRRNPATFLLQHIISVLLVEAVNLISPSLHHMVLLQLRQRNLSSTTSLEDRKCLHLVIIIDRYKEILYRISGEEVRLEERIL